ncbi:MAG: STAS domain-containing protein [Rhodocyclaceae bacterium]|nr:STAS domain-containing protein [Rhodocyclaceae bacterium]
MRRARTRRPPSDVATVSVSPLHLSGALTVDEAAGVLRAATAAIDAGCREVNVGQLLTVDSSAVATLIAIRRHAMAKGVDLRFSAPPPALAGLVGLYEVGDLLGLPAR